MLGSPLASFVTLVNDERFVRSKLPTCCEFYNIYHPLDLVAYRIEMLIEPYNYETTPNGTVVRKTEEGEKLNLVGKDEIPPAVLVPHFKNKGLNPS